MRRDRLVHALVSTALVICLGASRVGADLIAYTWSGTVRPVGENPWGLVETGAPFALRVFIPPDAIDTDGAGNPGHAQFTPELVVLDIADETAVVTNATMRFSDDDFGTLDILTLLAQAELFDTPRDLVASVRLPLSTFTLATPAAPDPPPVFDGTTPAQFGASANSHLSTSPADATVSGRLEQCGETPLRAGWRLPTSGNLGDVDVTLTGFTASALNYDFEVQGPDFAAAPLCSTAPTIEYSAESDWSASLSAPVDTLLVYAVFWRASGGDPVTHQFDAPFTITSGFGEALVENGGTRLSLPATTPFHSGILRFDGPISSLSVDTNSTTFSRQVMTLAVPEPSGGSASLAIFALLTCARFRARSGS